MSDTKTFEEAYERFRHAHINASFMPIELARAMYQAGIDSTKQTDSLDTSKTLNEEDPAIQHHSSKEGYKRVNHWINAPKEEK